MEDPRKRGRGRNEGEEARGRREEMGEKEIFSSS